MIIKVVSVGAKPSKPLSTLLDDYVTRLPRSISLTWHFVKHGNGSTNSSKQQEAESILRHTPEDYLVILLDETGTQYTSEKLSSMLFDQSKNIVFIIGGAYGVSESIKKRANIVLSLSDLVFPHQIVRLVLTEQIYRAYTISINHPYHHS
jgi:23S rRNA (pseudouridine1915-N3)-methyltransferase